MEKTGLGKDDILDIIKWCVEEKKVKCLTNEDCKANEICVEEKCKEVELPENETEE